MYRGHQAGNDAEFVVEDLGDGGKAVGGAGSIGNELCAFLVGVSVYAAYKHGGVVLGGSGHQNVLGAGFDVALSFFFGQEQTGGLDDILRAHLGPGQVGGITLCKHGDGLAVDDDGALLAADLSVELAVHCIVLQHIGQIVSGTQIVDTHDLDLGVIQGAAQDHAADAAKTIDTDFNAHKIYLPLK